MKNAYGIGSAKIASISQGKGARHKFLSLVLHFAENGIAVSKDREADESCL